MLFNSIDFAIFLPLVFILYWAFANRNITVRNIFLIIVSYIFYGWWDWRFLGLIILSSFIDFFVAQAIQASDDKKKRKIFLIISLCSNLGILGLFKYYNFFVENFVQAFNFLGFHFQESTLDVVLPVGISFYTFQTLSYTIDVYRKEINATKNMGAFFAYVSFFPQLVAGPIERAKQFLPQFFDLKKFDYENAKRGLRQILWGFFMKIVIADNAAIYVNQIFADHENYTPNTLLMGAILFALQIYGDFAGYSNIAIGTSRLFGFSLMQNFAFPYFSRDIAEFWRRWHISLSTWFRDYLYIPLGGSKFGKWLSLRNIFIIFLVSGFWHGANWTFIFWGLINALYFIPLFLFNQNRKNLDTVAYDSFLPNFREFIQIGITFFITCVAWVFFRAENISHAFDYLSQMLHYKLLIPSTQDVLNLSIGAHIIYFSMLIVFFVFIEWIFRKKEFGLDFNLAKQGLTVRWLSYFFVIYLIITFGVFNKSEFIYFSF